ncbi:hypothetical protein AYI68_g5806 [Smittium mucronatum]|uniref:F-box domain-containing protein n=1 Tax=Smittium mucronatum TaxID=133383 RepID=A0A1R0GT86_9FUNG|nr:hypothetical protein AYI68_g5806 [Smittium mucronatum]
MVEDDRFDWLYDDPSDDSEAKNWPTKILDRICSFLPTPKDKLQFSLVHSNWKHVGLDVLWRYPTFYSESSLLLFLSQIKLQRSRLHNVNGFNLANPPMDSIYGPYCTSKTRLQGELSSMKTDYSLLDSNSKLADPNVLSVLIRSSNNISHLSIFAVNLRNSDVPMLFQLSSKLQSLEINGIPSDSSVNLAPFFRSLKKVRSLKLRFGSAVNPEILRSILALSSSLEIFELYANDCRHELKELLSKTSNLRKLVISGDRNMIDDTILKDLSFNNPNLLSLAVESQFATPEGIVHPLINCTNLISLECSIYNSVSNNLSHNYNKINSKNISTLILNNVPFPTEFFHRLFIQNPKLSIVSLSNISSITSQSIISLAKNSIALQGLALKGCNLIQNSVIEALSQFQNFSLTSLIISECSIESSGLINNSLQKFQNIQCLSILGQELVKRKYEITLNYSNFSSTSTKDRFITKYNNPQPVSRASLNIDFTNDDDSLEQQNSTGYNTNLTENPLDDYSNDNFEHYFAEGGAEDLISGDKNNSFNNNQGSNSGIEDKLRYSNNISNGSTAMENSSPNILDDSEPWPVVTMSDPPLIDLNIDVWKPEIEAFKPISSELVGNFIVHAETENIEPMSPKSAERLINGPNLVIDGFGPPARNIIPDSIFSKPNASEGNKSVAPERVDSVLNDLTKSSSDEDKTPNPVEDSFSKTFNFDSDSISIQGNKSPVKVLGISDPKSLLDLSNLLSVQNSVFQEPMMEKNIRELKISSQEKIHTPESVPPPSNLPIETNNDNIETTNKSDNSTSTYTNIQFPQDNNNTNTDLKDKINNFITSPNDSALEDFVSDTKLLKKTESEESQNRNSIFDDSYKPKWAININPYKTSPESIKNDPLNPTESSQESKSVFNLDENPITRNFHSSNYTRNRGEQGFNINSIFSRNSEIPFNPSPKEFKGTTHERSVSSMALTDYKMPATPSLISKKPSSLILELVVETPIHGKQTIRIFKQDDPNVTVEAFCLEHGMPELTDGLRRLIFNKLKKKMMKMQQKSNS